ncbi:PKD domain-containing protein [Lentzea sp. PSKA42]|uniref:PKD domain-containing protein n=1 Tax=Lentzea indica TaxID=2604800 RepID=A0ABX1FFM4_9PSEU|nr:PKD domain-containing protein [Lentzea indica]NKE57730.1 PKD domain-containing protein [Lentzea indica]
MDVDPWDGLVGEKRTFTVTPNRTGVVSYVYKVGDEAEKQLPANADGSLTFEYTPTRKGDFIVRVASLNAAGVRSGWGETEILAEAPAPEVTSNDYKYEPGGAPGQAGTFTFSSPRLPVVSYKYNFDDEPWQTTTGTQVQWTPKKPGHHYLHVRGVTADGEETDERSYLFQVKPALPTVTSPQFPDGGPVTARPGEPIEFVVTPTLPGSHEVLWSISWGQTQVAPVGEDGKARFTHTVSSSSSFYLTVSSRTPDGVVSGTVERSYFVPQQ